MADNTYLAPLDNMNKCQACPNFCSKCILINQTPSCVTNHCFNGFYEVTAESGIITCADCTNTTTGNLNVLRCNSKIDIT